MAKKIIFWSLTDSTAPQKYDLEEGIGPYKLATIAKSKGYDSIVFQASQFGCYDPIIENMTKSELADENIIAVSALTFAYELLERLSHMDIFSEYPVLLGGPGATTSPKEFLKLFHGQNPVALVEGDGEELFGHLLDLGPARWHEADEAWTYDNEGLVEGCFQTLHDMDRSPFPDLSVSYQRKSALHMSQDEKLPLEERIDALRSLMFSYIETRRGCFFKCGYCSEPQLARKGVRRMTPKRTVDEMVHLFSDYGITFFSFTDNIAFDDKGWWNEFAGNLKDSGISHYITFMGYGTPKFFANKDWFDGTLHALMDVGLCSVNLGVQSGSERVLRDIIRRPHDDPENALAFVQKSVALGLNVKSDFIIGHPTERIEDLQATYDSMNRIYEAGGQVFVRRLQIVPNSGYHHDIAAGRYPLPQMGDDYKSLAKQILADDGMNGKRDSFDRKVKELGVVPRFSMIDSERRVYFPRGSMSTDELVSNQRRISDSDMPDTLKDRYKLLFELVMKKKEAEPIQYQQP